MIAGNVYLEDTFIQFTLMTDPNSKHEGQMFYTVTDRVTGKSESLACSGDKFMKALAIAVHYDGQPDYMSDYPDAESIMGTIRWIP